MHITRRLGLFLGMSEAIEEFFLKSLLDKDFRCYVALRYSFATLTPASFEASLKLLFVVPQQPSDLVSAT